MSPWVWLIRPPAAGGFAWPAMIIEPTLTRDQGAVELHWGQGRRAAGHLIRSIGADLNASVVDIAIIGAGPYRLSPVAA